MKLFDDIIKDAGVKSVHTVTALGNERGMFSGFGSSSYRFGRFRSQPRRQNRRATAAEGRRKDGDAKETSSLSNIESAKSPDLSLDAKDDNIVHASKSFNDVMKVTEDDSDAAAKELASVMESEMRRWRPRRSKKPMQTSRKDWNIPLQIMKFAPDQHLIFGWASVIERDGVVVIDKQGDIIPVEELENAAYEFNINSRSHGDMHARANMGKLVESMVFTKEKQDILGIDLKKIGWWTGFKISDAELWAAHKRGERPEFSIGGAAIPVEVEEIK